VRLVRTDEVAQVNALLDEYHWLGHHLFGWVLGYAASGYSSDWTLPGHASPWSVCSGAVHARWVTPLARR